MKRDESFNWHLSMWRSGQEAHLGILDELALRLDPTVGLDHDCLGKGLICVVVFGGGGDFVAGFIQSYRGSRAMRAEYLNPSDLIDGVGPPGQSGGAAV